MSAEKTLHRTLSYVESETSRPVLPRHASFRQDWYSSFAINEPNRQSFTCTRLSVASFRGVTGSSTHSNDTCTSTTPYPNHARVVVLA